jgi:hypothetical protein
VVTRHLAALALAATVTSACGGGPSSASPASASGFASELVAGVSGRLSACLGWTPAAAADWLEGVYDLNPAWIRANPAIAYDAEAGRACLAAVAGLTCAQLTAGPLGPPQACRRAFVGTVQAGGACTSTGGYDCAGYAWCRFVACNAPGTCTASDAGPGATCASVIDCAGGLGCLDGRCQPAPLPPPAATAGGSCQAATCPDPQWCDPTATCAPRAPDGASCGATPCAWGSRCAAGVCVRNPVRGDPCPGGAVDCPFGTSCAATGRCADLPGVGEPCGTLPANEWVPCRAGWCDAETGAAGACQPLKPLGATCTSGSHECGPEGTCDTGTCEASACR